MARGKNEVTVDLAGDASGLERAFKRAQQASEDVEKAFEGVSEKAKTVDTNLGRIGKTSTDGLDKAKRSADEYRSSIDRAGDSADSAETRFTGLASGIDGVTTLMASPSPQEFAQGIADVADGVANAAVPALKKGVDAIKGMNVAVAASVVGFIALGGALTVMAFQQQGAEIDVEKTTKALTSQDAAVQKNMQSTLKFLDSFGGLSGVFSEVLEKTPHLADEFIANAEAAGVSNDTLEDLREQMGEVASSSDFAATSIRGVSDALRAQSDPTFAALDAMNQLADANRAVDEATLAVIAAEAEFGTGSAEAQQAARDLSDAQVNAATASFGQRDAMLDLASSMEEAGFSVEDIIADMQGMADQGQISQSVVDSVADSLRNVPNQVNTALTANDLVTKEVLKAEAALARLPSEKRIKLSLSNWFGMADGGIVPQYLAAGGIGGPRGTDTVPAWLTPGEMVLNASQQANLFKLLNGGAGGGAGGPTINVYVAGSIRSDKDIEKIIADAQARGSLRGAAA